ncbi:type II toxin-antitoxin system VapC family toxin [Candidatus Woesearchaeota archaeon]|nr:type II toxin-antitoxin system VapC family toxin [Candidatus Woesearchaeota archaeon]
MNCILDTTVLVDIRLGKRGTESKIKELIDIKESNSYITLLTFAEYYFGCLSSSMAGQIDCLNFLNSFQHLTLSKNSAKLYSELTYKYKKSGILFSPIDLLNACIAIDENMKFITSDKSFRKINELRSIIIE